MRRRPSVTLTASRKPPGRGKTDSGEEGTAQGGGPPAISPTVFEQLLTSNIPLKRRYEWETNS